MRCTAVIESLPGYVGDDLLPATTAAVREHLQGCQACRAELADHERVRVGMRVIAATELEPPPDLVEAILRRVDAPRAGRKLIPVVPVPPGELVRLVAEHRDAIASAAGTAVLVGGAAYALWRAAERARRAQVTPDPA